MRPLVGSPRGVELLRLDCIVLQEVCRSGFGLRICHPGDGDGKKAVTKFQGCKWEEHRSLDPKITGCFCVWRKVFREGYAATL